MTLVVGVNGTGKTTTVGKLANLLRKEGRQPLICAADTFRAAAVEQLEIWAASGRRRHHARRRTAPIPAAVVFDAITSGKAKRPAIPILVDTAGRLHTRVNLMNELDKIRRIAVTRGARGAAGSACSCSTPPSARTASSQAREFTNVAGVNGIVLTKLDGTAKGGVAVAIAHDLKLADSLRGNWRGIDDLVAFRRERICGRACSKRSGDVLTASDQHDARVASRRARGADAPVRIRWSARSSCRRKGVVVGQGYPRARGRTSRGDQRARRGGDGARAQPSTARSSPARTSDRTGPVRRPDRRGRASRASSPRSKIRIRSCAAGDLPLSQGTRRGGRGRPAARQRRPCLNQPFFTLTRERRPFVVLKAATSLDGYIAESPGRRSSLTSDVANRHAHTRSSRSRRDRRRLGTILADDPLLTPRGARLARAR